MEVLQRCVSYLSFQSTHTHIIYIDVNIDINNFTKFETQIYDHYQQHALFLTFGV